MIKPKLNVSFGKYTTLKLGGRAKYFFEIKNKDDIACVVDFALSKNLRILPLGLGSNLVVSDHPKNMIVFRMMNKGIKIIKKNNDSVIIEVSAGEKWDDFVDYAIKNKLSGIEAMAGIPGTVGATPVQNVGAYGQEVKNVIKEVCGYNLKTKNFQIIKVKQCKFSYRDSIFKHELKGKFIIESVVFRLSKKKPKIPNYLNVKSTLEFLEKKYSKKSKIELIGLAIRRIRSEKLPDYNKTPNVGSFFKNVFVSKSKYQELKKKFPDIPSFVEGRSYKIPTGWLVENVGYKGFRKKGVGVYDKNALVLVNYSSKSSKDILNLAGGIAKAVKSKFGVKIEIEPEIVS